MKEVLVMMVISTSGLRDSGISASVQPVAYCEAVKAYGQSTDRNAFGHNFRFYTNCVPLPENGEKK